MFVRFARGISSSQFQDWLEGFCPGWPLEGLVQGDLTPLFEVLVNWLFWTLEPPLLAFGCTTLTNCSKYLPGFFTGTLENGMIVLLVLLLARVAWVRVRTRLFSCWSAWIAGIPDSLFSSFLLSLANTGVVSTIFFLSYKLYSSWPQVSQLVLVKNLRITFTAPLIPRIPSFRRLWSERSNNLEW